MPSSVNVPSSISSASRSRAVSLPAACCLAIRSSPPPSRAGRAALVELLDQRAQRAHSSGSTTDSIIAASRSRSSSSSGASKAVISTPITVADSASSPSRSCSPSPESPPAAGNCAGRTARVEHVEVEMDVDLVALERAGELVGWRRADARALELHALAAVEVAHAGHDHARGIEHAVAEPRVPAPAGGGEAHTAEEAARRRVGRVEVAVRVEPGDARRRVVAQHGRQRRDADRAVRREQHRKAPGGHRVVDLAARLEQAAAGVAQVVGEAAGARRARRADHPRLHAEQAPQPRRQRLGAAHPAGRAVRGPAAECDDGRAHRGLGSHRGGRVPDASYPCPT